MKKGIISDVIESFMAYFGLSVVLVICVKHEHSDTNASVPVDSHLGTNQTLFITHLNDAGLLVDSVIRANSFDDLVVLVSQLYLSQLLFTFMFMKA